MRGDVHSCFGLGALPGTHIALPSAERSKRLFSSVRALTKPGIRTRGGVTSLAPQQISQETELQRARASYLKSDTISSQRSQMDQAAQRAATPRAERAQLCAHFALAA